MSVVRVEREGDVAVWTVHRPDTRNAVDTAVAEALSSALDDLGQVRAVVLTGGGGTFISGGDLRLIRARPFEETLVLSRRMTDLLARFEACPVPILAAIEGYAYGGGCEVMLACDYRVSAPAARFSFRQAAMGLTTGWGACTRLAQRVPRGVAARLLMTAEVLEANDAHALGLIEEVTPHPLRRAVELAAAMAENPPAAVSAFKQTLAVAYDTDAHTSAQTEWATFATLWGGPDHRAALAAYFAKKKPS
ncbi:MAG: enoyl-CoA hydratase/isomerase family protein [Sandaracinaceae bacterium]